MIALPGGRRRARAAVDLRPGAIVAASLPLRAIACRLRQFSSRLQCLIDPGAPVPSRVAAVLEPEFRIDQARDLRAIAAIFAL